MSDKAMTLERLPDNRVRVTLPEGSMRDLEVYEDLVAGKEVLLTLTIVPQEQNFNLSRVDTWEVGASPLRLRGDGCGEVVFAGW